MLKIYFCINLIVFYQKIKVEPIIDINITCLLYGILTNIDFHEFDLNET